jgi:hypothetical protein
LGRFDRARELLNEIMSDGQAPDESRLLMVRIRIHDFLSRTSRLQPDSVPLEQLIDELLADRDLNAAGSSALKSFILAQVNDACCVAYSNLAEQLDQQQKDQWLRHSERVIEAYDAAVEQGMNPSTWMLVNSDLHPAVSASARDRDQMLQRLLSQGIESNLLQYRRAFLIDPLVGTPFERWKASSMAVAPDLAAPENSEAGAPASAKVARLN